MAKKPSAVGFEDLDIYEALSWLAGTLHTAHRSIAPRPDRARTIRFYASKECAKLEAGCRGLVVHLENSGVLDPVLR